MKIERFVRIRGFRIFRDFEWPSALPTFARYNLIFGWNGTGKTCLSNLFAALQRRDEPHCQDVQVAIQGRVIKHTEFSTATLPSIRVFNRDFVDRAVFETPSTRLPSVYYVGEDSASTQQRIADLKAQLSTNVDARPRLESDLKRSKSDFEAFCTERARQIKTLMAADPAYLNYEAPQYKKHATKLASLNVTPPRLIDTERRRFVTTASGPAMETLPSISVDMGDLTDLTIEVQAVLQERLMAAAIPELVAAPEIAAWVQRGLQLHHPHTAALTCQFCAQPVSPERLRQLEAHFNDKLTEQQGKIDVLLTRVEAIRKATSHRDLPAEGLLYPHLRERYVAAKALFSKQSILFSAYLDALDRALRSKREAPFTQPGIHSFSWMANEKEPTTLEVVLDAVLTGLGAWGALLGATTLDAIARLIESHNNDCGNYDSLAKQARAALEQDEVVISIADWRSKRAAVEQCTEQLGLAQSQADTLDAEITALERKVRHNRLPAEELTRELAAYLGRDELTFDVEENGYAVTRNGEPALHLSDGERTAIAFMYFLKSLKDTAFSLENGVVVIDDPVSSLDANSMFCAFAYMRERTRSAKQLFILTHNFYFFREVKNWLNFEGGLRRNRYVPSQASDVHFYMLTNTMSGERRNAKLMTLDPLLHRYDSEYHYLFARVEAGARADPPTRLDEVYGMPNIARRLLETFATFKVPDKAGELRQQIEALALDPPAKKARIVRFLHAHSHGAEIEEAVHDLSLLSETPAILGDVLELIRQNDLGHFTAMQAIAASAPT